MDPFKDPAFENLQVSPLGLVPKKKPGEYRLIHHLSYPEGSSRNDGIPPEFCTEQYQSIQDAILAIQQVGVGALLAKTDLENAYKQVPIHPQSFELLGFQASNEFYFVITLPFGLSYSCYFWTKLFQKTEDKLSSLRQLLSSFTRKRTTILREIQSLIGLLNFACAVVTPGRAFLRRITNLTKGIWKPHHHRNLDKEARADLKAWSIFIDHFIGKAFSKSGITHTSVSLHLFTDASNLGYVGVFGSKWFTVLPTNFG